MVSAASLGKALRTRHLGERKEKAGDETRTPDIFLEGRLVFEGKTVLSGGK
jgi:hypothetical protein